MTETRCTCGAAHATFGECMRAKGIQFMGVATHVAVKKWDDNLESYRVARKNGLQPASTKQKDIDYAWSVSNRRGEPFRADAS